MNSTRQIPEYVPRLINFNPKLNDLCTDTLVLTPNNRLSEALLDAFIQFQLDSGLTAWRTPQIYPFGKFIPVHYAHLQHNWPDKFPELLLNTAQQKLVWLSLSSELSSGPEDPDWSALSKLAVDSWSTVHEWCIDLEAHQFGLNDSSAFYQKWARLFKAKIHDQAWLTHSQVPDIIRNALPSVTQSLPSRILLYGFETETQQQTLLFAAFKAAGIQILRQNVNNNTEPDNYQEAHHRDTQQQINPPRIFQSPDETTELAYVAKWARALVDQELNEPGTTAYLPSIGIIVPDLERQHASIIRLFDSVFSPASIDADPLSRSFNISGGVSLNRITVCSDALRLLRWTDSPLDAKEIEALQSSPYLTLDGLKNSNIPKQFPLSMAYLNRGTASGFLQSVFAIEAINTKAELPLSKWSSVFIQVLDLAKWPLSEALESMHFQAAERLRRVLQELHADEDIVGPCNLASAVRYLDSIVAQIKFSPQSSQVPVQIMTALEADGLEFDHLWLLGFHNRAWPANPASTPFIPRNLLLEKAVPRASLQSELEFAQRYTSNLLQHSEQVNFSFAQYSGDEEFELSKLVEVCVGDVTLIEKDTTFHPLSESSLLELETYNDYQAPKFVPDALTKGGSGLLTDQSNCPFLALANHRLHASTRSSSDAFPDAADRGNILHRVLEILFKRIDNQEALKKLSFEERDAIVLAIIESCVSTTFSRFPKRFQQREIVRLANLVRQWIQVEQKRPPFSVVGSEVNVTCTVAGLNLNTRVDRIDIDEKSGRHIIIDYKTGKVRVKDWGGARPGQPQLPLYAIQNPEASTIFYAQVRDEDCKYSGLSDIYPATKFGAVQISSFTDLGADDWTALRNNWHFALEMLSNEFQAGYAEVIPANKDTCKYCEYKSLCRISAQKIVVHD